MSFKEFTYGDRIETVGFSDETDRQNIREAIKNAYENSSAAQEMFDAWFKNHEGQNIVINYTDRTSEVNRIELKEGKVYFNPEDPKKGRYIDNYGNVVEHSVLTVLIHELGHALNGYEDYNRYMIRFNKQGELIGEKVFDDAFKKEIDGGDYTDYRQQNVKFINTIFKQITESKDIDLIIPELNSYWAQGYNKEEYKTEAERVLSKDASYTNGANIRRSIVINNGMPVN